MADLKQQPAFFPASAPCPLAETYKSTKQSTSGTNNHSDLFLHRNTVGQIE
jgi:hypothetical protein